MSRRETDHQPLPEELAEEISQLRDALGGLKSSVVGMSRFHGGTNGTSTVTIDAGKGPAWIAAACALAMMVGLILGGGFVGVLLLDQSRRIGAVERDTRDLNDYLSAIYVAAPQLKPKEKTQ